MFNFSKPHVVRRLPEVSLALEFPSGGLVVGAIQIFQQDYLAEVERSEQIALDMPKNFHLISGRKPVVFRGYNHFVNFGSGHGARMRPIPSLRWNFRGYRDFPKIWCRLRRQPPCGMRFFGVSTAHAARFRRSKARPSWAGCSAPASCLASGGSSGCGRLC